MFFLQVPLAPNNKCSREKSPLFSVFLLFTLKCMPVKLVRMLGWEADLQGSGPRVQSGGEEPRAAAGSGRAFDQPGTKRSLGVSGF